MVIPKPVNEIIRIAEVTQNLPSTGKVNKQLPSFTLRDLGYDDDTFASAEELNYTFDNMGMWLQYFEDITDRDIQDLVDFEQEVKTRKIIAGEGLIDGGPLASDVTINMGTPSTLDGSSTNSTTATSHTHDLTIATTAQAQARTDDIVLMTPKKVDDSIKASYTGTSLDDYVVYPNGMIEQWISHTLGTAGVWEEVQLPVPFTIVMKNISLAINAVVGGSNDNSNVSVRPSVANPLTHVEVYQIGQGGDIMCNVKGY